MMRRESAVRWLDWVSSALPDSTEAWVQELSNGTCALYIRFTSGLDILEFADSMNDLYGFAPKQQEDYLLVEERRRA